MVFKKLKIKNWCFSQRLCIISSTCVYVFIKNKSILHVRLREKTVEGDMVQYVQKK